MSLKMKKQIFCCSFTWTAFIELNFTVAFLLIRKTWDDRFVSNIVYTPTPPFYCVCVCVWLGEGGKRGRGEGGRGLSLQVFNIFQIEPSFQKGGFDRISIFREGLLGKRE